MIGKIFAAVFVSGIFFGLVCSLFAHQKSMINTGYPKPPPTIDPGPDATLIRVHVTEAITGKTTSATACVNQGDQEPDSNAYQKFGLRYAANRHKGPIRFRPIPYYFFTNGRFEVLVPPGKTVLEFRKGYEYLPKEVNLTAVPQDTVDLEIMLQKAIDMPALGWYSGDTHIHMDRTGANDDTLLTITSAKDIHYAYLLSMNTTGYDRGEKYESWLQEKGLGDASAASKGSWHISSGQEYRTGRLGHVTIILPDEYVPAEGATDSTNKGPSLGVISDQTHVRRGFMGLAHGGYNKQEADGLLLEDKVDFLELFQFGGYRSLGLDGWYDFLNIGFRLPIVGACDFPYTRELGSEITYVWSDTPLTPRTFAQNLAAGRSFATSGPMVFLTVEDKKPGEVITFPEAIDTRMMRVQIQVESPLYPVQYLELIVNGQVVKREYAAAPEVRWEYQHSLQVTQSCWVAARAYADAGTDAHTNPVYIYVGENRPFDPDAARNILTRLDGSIETISNEDIKANLTRLKKELQNALGHKKTALPLPEIPR